MITGVSFPSYVADAAFTMTSGAAHADFPVQNLADLTNATRPFRASAAGAREFLAVLAADQLVQFVALARNNAQTDATYRFRLYDDDAATSLVHDSGTLTFGAASQFARTTPYLLDAAITVRAVRVNLSSMDAAWQVGGLEIAGFWDLSSPSARSLGMKPQDGRRDAGDGATLGTRQFSPRAVTTGLSLIDWTVEGVTFETFRWDRGTDKPFVWVRDAEDPETWPRECFLARNASLAGLTKNAFIYGALALDAIEHLQ